MAPALARLRAAVLGEYPSSVMAARTRAAQRTSRLPSRKRETVMGDTPARFATSCKVTMLFLRRFFLIRRVYRVAGTGAF